MPCLGWFVCWVVGVGGVSAPGVFGVRVEQVASSSGPGGVDVCPPKRTRIIGDQRGMKRSCRWTHTDSPTLSSPSAWLNRTTRRRGCITRSGSLAAGGPSVTRSLLLSVNMTMEAKRSAQLIDNSLAACTQRPIRTTGPLHATRCGLLGTRQENLSNAAGPTRFGGLVPVTLVPSCVQSPSLGSTRVSGMWWMCLQRGLR